MTLQAAAMMVAVAAAAVAAAAAVDPELVVHSPQGTVTGSYTMGRQARQFVGIPYAQPPVGPLRWQAPRPASPFGGVYEATKYGAGCVQNCTLEGDSCPTVVSEDCLYLNVFTPRNGTVPGPRPVLFFIHGGNFREGDGGSRMGGYGPLYSGRFLANDTGVVVVTINYRLGAQGFLASAGEGGLTGNFGIMDQQEALRWVQRNIAAYGGDPTRVTVMGQSAGAVSTAIHLFSPPSRGLLHQAAVISELLALPLRAEEDAHGLQAAFAKFAGCAASDLACLRALSWQQMLAAQEKASRDLSTDTGHFLESFMPFGPVVGPSNGVVPRQPYTAIVNGEAMAIPTLIGNVRNEGNLFIGNGFRKPVSSIEYDLLVGIVTGNLTSAARVLKAYPLAPNATADARPEMYKVTNDGVFFCSARNASFTLAERAPVYRYLFDYVADFAPQLWGPTQRFCWDAACHGGDLPFWFSPLDEYQGLFNISETDTALAHSTSRLLGNFVSTGDPNKPPPHVGGPAPITKWPLFGRDNDATYRISPPQDTVIPQFHNKLCDLWDTVGYPIP